MFQLIVVENALALEVKSEGKMIATSRAKGDPFVVAKRNGWTFEQGKGTKAARKRCLADVVAIRAASDPNYTPGNYVTEALGEGETQAAVAAGREWAVKGEASPFQ